MRLARAAACVPGPHLHTTHRPHAADEGPGRPGPRHALGGPGGHRLGRARSGRLRAGRIERSGLGPALPSKEELTMPTEKLLAQQAAARHDFDGRIARITTPEFVAGPLLHRLAKAAATRPGQVETAARAGRPSGGGRAEAPPAVGAGPRTVPAHPCLHG